MSEVKRYGGYKVITDLIKSRCLKKLQIKKCIDELIDEIPEDTRIDWTTFEVIVREGNLMDFGKDFPPQKVITVGIKYNVYFDYAES